MYRRSHYYYLLATSIQNIFDIFISITIPYQKQSAINSTLTFTAKNRKQNKKKPCKIISMFVAALGQPPSH